MVFELSDVIAALLEMHERFEPRSESRGDDEVLHHHMQAIKALQQARAELGAWVNKSTVLDALEVAQ